MMTVIQPSCRRSLQESDHDFVVSTLGVDLPPLPELPGEELVQLLDDVRLSDRIGDDPGLATLSPALFFYLIVRQHLLAAGVEDPDVADYLATLLVQHAHEVEPPVFYVVDYLSELSQTTGYDRFGRETHLANQMLVLGGLHADWVEARRERRAAPALSYYESIGASCFRAASQNKLAGEFALTELLFQLADQFPLLRRLIWEIRERRLHFCPRRFDGLES